MRHFQFTAILLAGIFLFSACGAPTQPAQNSAPQPAQTQPPIAAGAGGITNTSVKIVQEQGSGAVCTANSTYFVYLDVTSNGPTTAQYQINATDASGQVPDGVFDSYASPSVSDTLTFTAAETKSVTLRLMGPYSYPDTITIRTRVNGGEWRNAQVVCQ